MNESLKVTEFDVVFEAKGTAVGRMRNKVDLTWVKRGNDSETFSLATDEGVFHGGENTAPPPLAYFGAALVGCLMTQIRAFSKRMQIPIRDVKVNAKLQWKGRQIGRNPYETQPKGFSVDVDIDSDASEGDLLRLVDAAKKGCFVEQTLMQSNRIQHRLKREGGWTSL
ncbi:OsmC family protein [Tropicibacter sp. Alg240-R139]|uniref:OsmC family protein n=1 Tax=Tropicibacter sp. Alg240-R139 TaxID=2305991 RepID=UPI0013DE9531|nr:OsmC family protein [Tropicibacter sp. Alg240-R139]